MLRLGIIGCGRVTSMFHLKAIEQVDEISVTAVSDINEERMREVKTECLAPVSYLDYKQLLKDENVEAVAVNTPPRFHEAIVLDALEHGKHVLCEKPLAESVEGCMRIKELQREKEFVVLPGHNYAFTPSLAQMEKYLKDGSIGEITSIDIAFENLLKSYRSQTNFREHTENGIVEDVLPHILSVVQPLVGHISDVKSVKWWCKDYDVCDNMETMLESENGVSINASLSWTKLRPRFSVSVNGERGRLYTDLMMNPFKLEATIDNETTIIKDKGVEWYLDLVRFKHPSFENQYRHFHQLVKEKASPLITIDDEINILQTIEEVSRQMER